MANFFLLLVCQAPSRFSVPPPWRSTIIEYVWSCDKRGGRSSSCISVAVLFQWPICTWGYKSRNADKHEEKVTRVYYNETKREESSTTWMVQCGADRRPLWLAACGIRVPAGSGWSANSVRSSIAGRLHWHRRRGQTFPHNVHPGIHHTFGRLEHMALPQPERELFSLDWDIFFYS